MFIDTLLEMDINEPINQLNVLAHNARIRLFRAIEALKTLDDEDEGEGDITYEGGSIEERAHLLHLVLQYRLDTQDAILQLARLEHGLLQILGVSPHHPEQINLERIAYALGQDDLKSMLKMLSALLDHLLRVANRYRKQLTTNQQPHHPVKHSKIQQLATAVEKATRLQQQFIESLSGLKFNLDKLNKRAAIGPTLDHVAALRGPISQFYQALQNGLDVTHRLYAKATASFKYDEPLAAVLKQAETVLKQVSTPSAQKINLFAPPNATKAEKLEERASAKRLGHFFQY